MDQSIGLELVVVDSVEKLKKIQRAVGSGSVGRLDRVLGFIINPAYTLNTDATEPELLL